MLTAAEQLKIQNDLEETDSSDTTQLLKIYISNKSKRKLRKEGHDISRAWQRLKIDPKIGVKRVRKH